MEHQDWNTVVWHKKEQPNKERQNKNPPGTAKFRALDGDEPPAPKKVSQDVRMAIQKARCAKKMTQKELANRLNLSASTINEYESGKAIPNRQILSRIGRALGVKLN